MNETNKKPVNDGGQAFPRTGYFDPDGPSECDATRQDGMTLRQWYAGLAMQGMNANPELDRVSAKDLADLAFIQADAMIQHEEQESR